MAKLITCFLVLSSLFSVFPTPTFAHVRGQPIFKINQEYTLVHPLQTYREDIFDLPADTDIAPENYLVDQELIFSLEADKLPSPPEVLDQTTFIWDFGDGEKTKTVGTTTTIHTYKEIGTKTLVVYVDYTSAGFPDIGEQPIQATLLNILPNKDYKLPTALIEVDSRPALPPGKGALDVDMSYPLRFDASKSRSGTSPIQEYTWDFDDSTQSQQAKTVHAYELPQYYLSPVLRVTDQNGFYIDTMVDLRNIGDNQQKFSSGGLIKWGAIILGIQGVIVLIFCIWLLIKRKKPRK